LKQRLLGENHPDVALSLNNLANLYNSQGRYVEAEPLHLQALELRKQLLGKNHPDVAYSLNNLAELYRSQGRYAEAVSFHLQALELRKQLLGKNHPLVAASLNNLALLYNTQGKYTEAEALSQEALTIYQRTLGNQHPQTQNAFLAVKGLRLQILLHCDTQTLVSILQALAQQAKIPAFNPEVMLIMLEALESNAELLSRVREFLQSDTLNNEHPNTTTTRKNLQIRRQQQHPTSLTWLQRIIVILLMPFYWLWMLIRWLLRRFIR
jgi:tetratricopeptide (TPR) repeat protein